MKISTKFNLFIGFFFFFVFLAVFYSYCGGLIVCYSFPFLNGFKRGSVSKAKVMMTSYIIDEKGESRDETNTIYFYSKVKDESHQPKEMWRKPGNEDNTRKKPGNEDNTRKKTGPESHNAPSTPSDITGKAAVDILRKANVSLEEANRKLYREEKVDKQLDRENLSKSKPMPTQSTPITNNRGDLGLKHMNPRVHPIRKPPRRLKKGLRKNRINRLTKQDRIDKAVEKKLERANGVLRMRGYGRGNKSHSLKTSHLRHNRKNPIKHQDEINTIQTESKKNFTNEALSPLDISKYRNELITFTKPHSNEAEWRNSSLTSTSSQHFKNNIRNTTFQYKNKSAKEMQRKKRKRKTVRSEKGLQQNEGIKQSLENKLFSKETEIGSYGNNMTSFGKVKMKSKKKKTKRVEEGSGIDGGRKTRRSRSVSTGELVQTIRNISDQQVKLALQSALNKDERQLKYDVMRIKTSLEEHYRPFNLTKVLRELVSAAETDVVGEQIPGTRMKEEILLKKRNSADWNRPLVRVKRLGKIRRRNDESERSLVRVKRIDDYDEDPRNFKNEFPGGQLDRAKRLKNNGRVDMLKEFSK